MTKTNVALLTNIFNPHRVELLRALNDQAEICLDTYFCAAGRKDRISWAVDLESVPRNTVLPGFVLSLPFWRKRLHYHINPSIISVLRKNHYDAIILGGYDSWTMQVVVPYARLTKTPLILWGEISLLEKRPRLVRAVKAAFLPLLIRKYSAFIASSTRSKEYLVHYGAAPDHIHIAPLTVEVDWFLDQTASLQKARGSLKEKMGIQAPLVLLYVGRLIPEKGVGVLLEAYQRLILLGSKAALVIVGEGPQEKELRRFCSKHQLHDVHFMGIGKRGELPSYYTVGDIMVVPSLSEPFGVVVVEALASGLPVITTDVVGAVRDLVQDGVNGRVVPAGRAPELCEAMRHVLEDEALRKTMGEHSRQIVQTWTHKESVEGFLAAIADATQSKGSPCA